MSNNYSPVKYRFTLVHAKRNGRQSCDRNDGIQPGQRSAGQLCQNNQTLSPRRHGKCFLHFHVMQYYEQMTMLFSELGNLLLKNCATFIFELSALSELLGCFRNFTR